MIKGRIQAGDKAALLLGLSRENCERLLDGQPCLIKAADLAELGLPDDMEIVLVADEDEAAIVRGMGGPDVSPMKPGQQARYQFRFDLGTRDEQGE